MKAHRTDVLSLAFGLLFLTVAVGFAARGLLHVDLPRLGWFLAGGGILIGLVIAVTALVPDSKPAAVQNAPQEEVPAAAPDESEEA